uniref:BZIP domain-containing protein n=1 Tax=Panagrolaimus davidi TaxID=227884 RepID=A0A914PFC4_9BILA
MEDLTSMEIGFPTLTATIPSTTTINFGLPAHILQLYHTNTPVNTNELSIYNPGNIYISPTLQKINPTIINLPHSLPPVPKDIADLIGTQQPTDPYQKDAWSYQSCLHSPILSPMTIDMDIDAAAEEPIPRPIPTRRPYYSPSRESSVHSDQSDHSDRKSSNSPVGKMNKSRNSCSDEKAERRKKGNTESQARSRQHNKVIKEAYENNDMLIEEIKLMYLKSGHSDDTINKLLMRYKTLPKKERPYKKRGTPCPTSAEKN